MRTTRRQVLLGLTGAAAALGGLEALSLFEKFDHRKLHQPESADGARYAASLERLVKEPALAAGAIVHVGHSTHLLSIGGLRFLTDPWFYDPAFGALSHIVGPAVPPEKIGTLDCLLVTHDHADHADLKAIDRLEKKRAVVATDDLAKKMKKLGFAEAHVLRAWESMKVGDVEVAAVPGVHDIYEVGFVVRGGGHALYFAGDTRIHAEMPAIAERYAPTFAILPVDGTRLNGDPLHVMTPEDAVVATRTLKVRGVMPSHAEAEFSDPLVELAIATTIKGAPALFAKKMAEALPGVTCRMPKAGEILALPG